jgi:phenylalanyl-tRNA synthetase beta chain
MKISELWLREWVNPALTGPQLAAQLTMAGIEVDGLNPVAGSFDHVVVAAVLATKPHPQADKLTLCEVDAGTGEHLHIVCGASNVRPGLKVALAMIGAQLPGDIQIKESQLRGQLSQGMLCSVAELGLEDSSDGIMELPTDAPIGLDLRAYLQLEDHVFDINLTPNRGDCFSVLGIARDLSALNQQTFVFPTMVSPAPVIDQTLPIHLSEPNACPRYAGRMIRAINPQAITPIWMKERLRRSGIRSLHPVVDVTNYVMLELGQPMHAFDLTTIESSIQVRYATQHEKLVLLDGQELNLDEATLVIADGNKPLAIAGVMGGQESAVQAETTHIFLESAFFNPVVVAGVARRFGLNSDSSQRFERGVDPQLQTRALERATELLLSIVGGEAGPVIEVNDPAYLPAPVSIAFNTAKVKQITGVDVPVEDMRLILKHLGMHVTGEQQDWLVGVPSHRFDLTLDVDLVEEIIRLYGYDHIKAQPLILTLQSGQTNESECLQRQVASFLSHRGYTETISYSFVDPSLQQTLYPDAKVMQLLNPISSELAQMRVGLWPGLLASMVYNAHRQQTAIQCFETGVIFEGNGDTLQERPCVAALLMGDYGQSNWSETAGVFDFYDMKGDIEALFADLKLRDVEYIPATHPALHPGQSARIVVNGRDAGWLGVLHPRLLDELGIQHEVILFELSLFTLTQIKPVRYQQISKYPQIKRDLSLLANIDVSASDIERVVRDEVDTAWLKSFDVFDVYTGENIPAGKKSLAIGLTLQDDHRTLVDLEINAIIDAILKRLENQFAITLRD